MALVHGDAERAAAVDVEFQADRTQMLGVDAAGPRARASAGPIAVTGTASAW
jgi:hypothetical protein